MIKKVFAVTATAAMLATGMSATVGSASAEAKPQKLSNAACKSLWNKGVNLSVKTNTAYFNQYKYAQLAKTAKTAKLRKQYVTKSNSYAKQYNSYQKQWDKTAASYRIGGCGVLPFA